MESIQRNSYWREYAYAFCATISLLAGGASFAWTSPTLPMLMDPSLDRPITSDEGSWIVSLLILASAVSPIPTIYMVDRWGRKLTLLLGAIPIIGSWIIIMFNTTPEWLYVSRLMSGWNFGVIYTVIPMYLGEIASKEVRGSVGILITVMAKVGVLLAYSIGPYLSIILHACVQIIFPLLFIITFIWSPESPYYLILSHQEEKAERALQRLRGRQDVKQELYSISATVKYEQENPGTFMQLFQTQGNRRGVLAVIGFSCGMQLCGSQSVLANSQQIFEEADGILDPKLSTILLGVVQLASAVLASMIVDKVGRRPLLILSGGGVSVMSGVIGAYFFAKDYLKLDMTDLTWLPILMIIIYIALYNIGLSTVSFALIGELFPTNIKAIASSSATVFIGLLSFAVTKLYQVIADSLGIYAAFWIFCGCATASFIVIIIYVPETKGKTLAQIQIDINQRAINNDENSKA